MTLQFTRLKFLLAYLAAGLTLGACQTKVDAMTPEETQHVASITADMRSRCIGRYIIDMPKAFTLYTEDGAEFEGVKIVKLEAMSKPAFDLQVDGRHKVLSATHMAGKPERPFLSRVEPTPMLENVKVFNRAESTGVAEFGRTLELWGWKQGYKIRMEITATDGSNTVLDPKVIGTPFETSSRRIFEEYKNRNDTPQKLKTLLEVYSRVSGRKDNEIPTTQGVCFVNGFYQAPPSDTEEVPMSYILQGTPDVYFHINLLSTVKEKDTMLQRSAQIEASIAGSDKKTIRKGKRDINGLPYEEWLGNGTTVDRVFGTSFTLRGNETRAEPKQPMVDLVLYNGERIPAPPRTLEQKAQLKDLEKASLTPDEAVAVWDKVTATLRMRPGAF